MSKIAKVSAFPGVNGAKLFHVGLDTLIDTASSVVAGTNDTSFYTITFGDVPNGVYRMVLYIGTEPVAVEELVNVADQISTDPIGPPAMPGLCTVRVPVIDLQGQPLSGCNVTVDLDESNSSVASALVARTVYSAVTGPSGYADLTLIQFASFITGGIYKLNVSDPSGRPLHKRRVKVPSVSTCYVDDLIDA